MEQARDLHREAAAEYFGVKPEKVTLPQREFIKRLNFGMNYGMGAKKLAAQRPDFGTPKEGDVFYIWEPHLINPKEVTVGSVVNGYVNFHSLGQMSGRVWSCLSIKEFNERAILKDVYRGFREGDKVRVKGEEGTAVIRSLLSDIEGGVFLETPIGDCRYWNVDVLIRVRKAKKEGNGGRNS